MLGLRVALVSGSAPAGGSAGVRVWIPSEERPACWSAECLLEEARRRLTAAPLPGERGRAAQEENTPRFSSRLCVRFCVRALFLVSPHTRGKTNLMGAQGNPGQYFPYFMVDTSSLGGGSRGRCEDAQETGWEFGQTPGRAQAGRGCAPGLQVVFASS
uniref:Uncharacterized protein n=1 Tax=Malurus cyaneus samueli TaxID=2593467 RepID=A0A8C5X782_9PASS